MVKKRLIASAIDWSIIIMLLAMVSIWQPNHDIQAIGILKFGFNLIFLCCSIIFKDLLFRNASLGKWIMGLQILQEGGENKASVSSILKRNIVLIIPIIFYIELYKIVKGHCRLADSWFHTKVV